LVAHVPVAVERRVVDEDVDAAEALHRRGDARLHRRGVGHVAVCVVDGSERAQFRKRLRRVDVVDVGELHRRALAEEALGVRTPDAPGTSGDDGDAPFESHGSSSTWSRVTATYWARGRVPR